MWWWHPFATLGAVRTERSRWWTYLLFFLPLLSRVRKEEYEEPDKFKAGRLYQTILLNPGINLAALRTVSGLQNGTLIYHLDRLEKDGSIISKRLGQLRLFFPSEEAGDLDELEGGVQHLRETQKRILILLFEHPDISQKDIVKSTGMKQQLVSYHLRELIRKGHVKRKGLKGCYKYRAEEPAAEVLSEAS